MNARVYFRAYNAQDERIASGYSADFTVDSADWQELTYHIVLADLSFTGDNTVNDIATLRVGVRLYKQENGNGNGDIYIDDVTLTGN